MVKGPGGRRGADFFALLWRIVVGCLAGGVSSATSPWADVPQYTVRAWGQAEGAPANRINDIIEGSDGFLWIASYEGLIRFDGHSHRIYNERHHPGLVGGIYAVAESEPGTLWMMSTGGVFLRLRDGVFTTWTRADGLSAEVVEFLIIDPQNRVVLPGRDSFLTVDEEDRLVPYPTEGLDYFYPLYATFDREGTFWISHRSGGLWSWREGEARHHDLISMGAPGDRVTSMHVRADNAIWLDLSGRIGKLSKDRSHLRLLPEESFHQPNRRLRFSTGDGPLVLVGTILSGLTVIAGDEARPFSYITPFLDPEMISSIRALRGGGYAVGTYANGVILLQESKVAAFGRLGGMDGWLINAIHPATGGGHLVASHSGVSVFREGRFEPFIYEGAPFELYTVDVFVDSRGRTWLGTLGEGLFFTDGETSGRFSMRDHLNSNSIRTIAEDAEGHIWIGTADGLHRWDGENMRLFRREHGLGSNFILSSHIDSSGNIWLGSQRGGLNRVSLSGIGPVAGEDETLAMRTVFAIHPDRAGNLWAGMAGGVIRVSPDGETVASVDLFNYLDATAFFHVIDDHVGSFWLTSGRGLFQIDYDALHAAVDQGTLAEDARPRFFGRWHGLPTDAMRANSRVHRGADKRLWIPTENGFFILDPEGLPESPFPPRTYIDEVEADGVILGSASARRFDEAVAGPGLRRIRFNFTAPSFGPPEGLTFEMRLAGFEETWRSSTGRSVDYTNLPPGSYRFEVRAVDALGLADPETAVFLLTVRPFFHETRAFIFLIIVTIGGFGVLFFQMRTRNLRLQQAILQAEVEARTREIRLGEQRLAKTNEELRRANEEKNEFLGIATHDLKSPLAVIEGLTDLLQIEHAEKGLTEFREYTDGILESSRRMSALIINLLDINRIERGEAALRAVPVPAVEAMEAAIDRHSTAAGAKEISFQRAYSLPHETLVQGDTDGIAQVLDNFISNAIKFSPRSSRVHFTISRVGEIIRFGVRDEGPGLSAEDQAHLFVKFARLSARPTGGELSTGLGLSIAKRLAELMNGRVGCVSKFGEGAFFYFDLSEFVERPAKDQGTTVNTGPPKTAP